jgi:hypothetical protein
MPAMDKLNKCITTVCEDNRNPKKLCPIGRMETESKALTSGVSVFGVP